MTGRNALVALAGALITAAALALTPTGRAAAAAAAKLTDVVFTDSAGNEVGNTVQLATGSTVTASPAAGATFPVSGSVSVSNSSLAVTGNVAVAASQSVSPSSTFAGATKSAVLTVNAYEGRQGFFQFFMLTNDCPGTDCARGSQVLSLGGKRLVLEHISGNLSATAPITQVEIVGGQLGTDVSSSTFRAVLFLAPVPLLSQAVGGTSTWALNQQVHLYLEDGDTVLALISSFSDSHLSGEITLNGYLIDP